MLFRSVFGAVCYTRYRQQVKLDNYPYEPDTPVPDPHTGTFVSDHGTMTFNGDGKTVVIDIDGELAGLAGLPEGINEGTYVFLSGDLPPHGSMEIRYDVAHELQIEAGGTSVVIDLGIAAADGKSGQSGVGTVTEERIPLMFKGEDGFFSVIFIKGE